MVQLVKNRTERALDIGEIHHPSGMMTDGAPNGHTHPKRVTMETGALMSLGNVRESMCGLEGEFLEDVHRSESRGESCGRASRRGALPAAQHLVGLQAQAPLGMREAVAQCECRVLRRSVALHWLQRKVGEIEPRKSFGKRIGLGKDELELVTRGELEGGTCLRAHANPVDSGRGSLRAVCLHRHFEAGGVQRDDGVEVELQQGFTPRADYIRSPAPVTRPTAAHHLGQLRGAVEAAAVRPHPHEIGIAKGAHGAVPIGFATAPQIAAGEATEDRRPSGVNSFTLQRVEDFLHRVHEKRYRAVSENARSHVSCRIAHAGIGESLLAQQARVAMPACYATVKRIIAAGCEAEVHA